MRKVAAVSVTVLFLLILFYSIHFFTKNALAEYSLHQINTAINTLNENPKSVSRRQHQAYLQSGVDALDKISKTALNNAQIYQIKAKLLYSISELEVWPEKRSQYFNQALFNNYNAINSSHFDVQYWLFDLQLQSLTANNDQNIFWSMTNVLNLGKWNNDVLAYASFYCVLKWQKLPKNLKSSCSTALKKLWSDDLEQRKLKSELTGIYRYESIVKEMLK